jgi:hypothetical protein
VSALNVAQRTSVSGRQTGASATNGSVFFELVPVAAGAHQVQVSGGSEQSGTLAFDVPVFECT